MRPVWDRDGHCEEPRSLPYAQDAEEYCVNCYALGADAKCGLDTNTEISENIKGLFNDYVLFAALCLLWGFCE